MQNRIRHFRKLRGLTQEELGARVGMASGHLSRLERGEVSFTSDRLESIARALGVRPVDLIDDAPEQSARERAWVDLLRSLPPKEQDRLIRLALLSRNQK